VGGGAPAATFGWDTRAASQKGASKRGGDTPTSVGARATKAMLALPAEVLDARAMIVANGFPIEIAVKLLQNFERYFLKIVDQMREYEATDAWTEDASGSHNKTVGALAHQVKGAALQVGASRLIASCRALQKAASEGKSPKALAALQTWYTVSEELLDLLKGASLEELFKEPALTKHPTASSPADETATAPSAAAAAPADVKTLVREAQLALKASYDAQLLQLEKIAAALSG